MRKQGLSALWCLAVVLLTAPRACFTRQVGGQRTARKSRLVWISPSRSTPRPFLC